MTLVPEPPIPTCRSALFTLLTAVLSLTVTSDGRTVGGLDDDAMPTPLAEKLT